VSQVQRTSKVSLTLKHNTRPNVLFFDETYDENHYKSDTVLNRIAVMDCLIVIGTTLETNLASKIVEIAVGNDILIVEVNPEPCIQVGNVKQLVGKAEEIVPELIKEVKKFMIESKA
jgi:NAD-dependent deacetylase